MDSKSNNSFSIDFLTRDGFQKQTQAYYQTANGIQNGDSYRRTPSPSDSGMESDPSPPRPTSIASEDSLTQVQVSENVFQNFKTEEVKRVVDDKPTHSYIALISMAILSSPDRRMLLNDIYQFVMDKFKFYDNDEKAWRNSIRHNLSLNECFIKAGRADNGKGNFWTIHPACVDDFANGDFRRRQARRRARKSLKEPVQARIENSSALHHYVGYVPMTASHLAYHPYSSASLYYPQSPALSQTSTQQSSSLSSTSSTYDTTYVLNGSQAFSPASSPTQNIFREHPNAAAITMQALAAQQQLANSVHFPNMNW